MKISSVNAVVTSEDLLSILRDVIEEYVEVEGIVIDEVRIDKSIIIIGKYSNKVNISFEASFDISSVVNNMIKLKINKIKVGKLKIFKFVSNFGLKKGLKQFAKYGVFVDKDFIIVAMDTVCTYIPKADFNILSIIVDDNLKVELDNINVSLKEEKVQHSEKKVKEEKVIIVSKKVDLYSGVRQGMIDKVPDKYEKIVKYAMIVPDIFALFVRLFKDDRVELKTKALVGSIIAYLALPIDILPDFIPFIGKIDDVAIAFFGLNKIINEIPKEVVLENWQGEDDIISVVSEGVYYISNLIGADKVGKVLKTLKPKVEEKKINECKK